mmetsp:Transcript_11742/g.27198  ORF Transcript_11742/g.27198 Transcript_11742/m.27198 type:complete len:101 (-) Transcript_11742:15-317(-)
MLSSLLSELEMLHRSFSAWQGCAVIIVVYSYCILHARPEESSQKTLCWKSHQTRKHPDARTKQKKESQNQTMDMSTGSTPMSRFTIPPSIQDQTEVNKSQ